MPDREELEVFLSEAFYAMGNGIVILLTTIRISFTYLIASVKHASNYGLSYPGAIFDLDRFFRENGFFRMI